MASLQELLAEEGFEDGQLSSTTPVKFLDMTQDDEPKQLPGYFCRGRKSLEFAEQKPVRCNRRRNSSLALVSERAASMSERLNANKSLESEIRDEPAIDTVAIKAVISILSGYAGRYVKDESFRISIREKCGSCLARKKRNADDEILKSMEMGIDSIEKLVDDSGIKRKERRMKSLRNSIGLLNVVASLNSKKMKNGSTCGITNSYLSACAQLYLSISYKLEKNDRISARHLLQVFCDSPFLARTHLLPDLWEHLFLPHLLHLRVWYTREVEFLSSSDDVEDERKLKCLSKLYNDQLDMGTARFALYYKQWLKVGVEAPSVPDVPLPLKQSHEFSRNVKPQRTHSHRLTRRQSLDSYTTHSSISGNLYQAVFGCQLDRRSMDLECGSRKFGSVDEGNLCSSEENCSSTRIIHDETLRISSRNYCENQKVDLWPKTQKPNYFSLLNCQSVPIQCLVSGNGISSNSQNIPEEIDPDVSDDLGKAISRLCCSNILSECETAIHVITKAWLSSHGGHTIEASVSKAPVIEGMLKVSFASQDDKVLELVISLITEIVVRNGKISQIVLSSDPQLKIFIRLLKRSSVFLKAAILLYHLKPKAKQMISPEWVLLILRVLEFGDQLQTLFTVCCAPRVAAFYMLNQLVFGFDEDKNLENARYMVSLGGLNLLIKRIDVGEFQERTNAAVLTSCCIQADGTCRNYVAENINKASLLELIVLEYQKKSTHALNLLIEFLCLSRRSEINKFLCGVKSRWGGLNAMQVLLIYLQRASLEKRPLFAIILLQLDLLGDCGMCSLYREEALEAIIAALDCQLVSENIQEQVARSLLMLGGHFLSTGEPVTEQWLLQKLGFPEDPDMALHSENTVLGTTTPRDDEEEETENWLRKTALVLLRNGRFLTALSVAIENGIPVLVRAGIVTVSWLSRFLHLVEDGDLQLEACSILMPQMLKSLNFDRALEERVLASSSLLNLIKSSGRLSTLSVLNEELMSLLCNLSQVTWTADELLCFISTHSVSPCLRA
ncbi:putative E3 ubiquitin-protein ligase LIN isoform X1 [Eucalyptus grandis]|nr:putative E3 ubiquitin-protein ligase LIN isoform X1 [Eucalyptus grandis]